MLATRYTNDVRRRNGVSEKLKVGTESQLRNAVRYAKVLGDLGRLEHQDLGEAAQDVGCNRFIVGENIAMNFGDSDVAKTCVDQWENSAGHLENILRPGTKEVVVGFHFNNDGRIYCVQTFASGGQSGGGGGQGCTPVTDNGGSSGSSPPPETPPSPPPAQPSQMPPSAPSPSPMQKPPSPSKEPDRSGTSPGRGVRESYKACRCLIRGMKCPERLAMKTGGVCVAGVDASSQPETCREACCSACRMMSSGRWCGYPAIQDLC